jgi:predicted secreted protein
MSGELAVLPMNIRTPFRNGRDVLLGTDPPVALTQRTKRVLAGLKFNEALPERLATATLATRLADLDSAARVLAETIRFTAIEGISR